MIQTAQPLIDIDLPTIPLFKKGDNSDVRTIDQCHY